MVKQLYVLVVNDDPDISRLMCIMLERCEEVDCETATADDGETALTMIAERVPDLIVSDTRMPFMHGFELFQATRANPEWAHIPFVFNSPILQDQMTVKANEGLQTEGFVMLPFQSETLINAVCARLNCLADDDEHRALSA